MGTIFFKIYPKMAETLTSLDIGISHTISYKIHPSVIVNILDVYYRNTTKDFILGVLLGKIYPDYVNITNVVFVPSTVSPTGEIGIDSDLLNKVLAYNDKIFNETRVGWFITKNSIDSTTAIIHKHLLPSLKSQTNTWAGPLVLLVDPSLEDEGISLKGFVSQPNKMFRDCFALFRPVKIIVDLFNEKLATGQLLYKIKNDTTSNESNETTFSQTLSKAKRNLESLQEHLSKMDEKELLVNHPDLIKEVKNLMAMRFMSDVNTFNTENIDRFIEDNNHLNYLNDLAHLQVIVSEKLANRTD